MFRISICLMSIIAAAASFCDSHGDALLCAESCEPVVKAETVVAVGLSQPAMVDCQGFGSASVSLPPVNDIIH